MASTIFSTKWVGWSRPRLVSVAIAVAMSSTRDWYWPSTMPSYGWPPFSRRVTGMPGMDLATPKAWAMSAVSWVVLSSSFWMRM